MEQQRNMQFLQLAMQHLPEAKALLESSGVPLDMSKAQPVLELLMKVMNDAYELGRREALAEQAK
ncbi:ComZ family protein [Ectobacillus ponti]|uniref:ComZ family protein n=1 Tax=Ectobacillus ponti TaxID=2961894 RepID=A0AA41XA78_9BACI|nr:ComZ family protein [Ectobacillus ponti]MCP8968296.1 ComZ family protein [Ectobacillus ponti]